MTQSLKSWANPKIANFEKFYFTLQTSSAVANSIIQNLLESGFEYAIIGRFKVKVIQQSLYSVSIVNWKERGQILLGSVKDFISRERIVSPIWDGSFWGCSQMGAQSFALRKTCHAYPRVMKLRTVTSYIKKIQKTYKSRDTSLEFCWHQYFSIGNQQVLLYQEILIYIAFSYITSIF